MHNDIISPNFCSVGIMCTQCEKCRQCKTYAAERLDIRIERQLYQSLLTNDRHLQEHDRPVPFQCHREAHCISLGNQQSTGIDKRYADKSGDIKMQAERTWIMKIFFTKYKKFDDLSRDLLTHLSKALQLHMSICTYQFVKRIIYSHQKIME